MYDVTVIGPAVIDILASPFDLEAVGEGNGDLEEIRMSFGGDALNESVVLARLEKKVQLISKVGDDEAGRRILDHLRERNVSVETVSVARGMDTAINIALIAEDGSRRFLMNPHSSLRKLGPEDVLPRIDKMAQIVCFASMFISPLFTVNEMKSLFAEIKKSGRMLVVDMTRPKNGETFEDLRELFPYMDVFLPNDEEICRLTGEEDPAENVRVLVEAGVGTAVVKTGKEGCIVGTAQGSGERGVWMARVPAVPGIRCVDTTGAGDTFAAGFIAGLCRGWSAVECARLGCAAASCSVAQIGATDGVRSLRQVMERYDLIFARADGSPKGDPSSQSE